jgi:CRISPR-associated protein Csd1
MIKELSDLGKLLREQKSESSIVHNALEEIPIDIELIISKDGDYIDFRNLSENVSKKSEKQTTIAEFIPAKQWQARLLLDRAEEVLCYKNKIKKHDLFLGKLNKYRDVKELNPVILFYESNRINGVEKALANFEIRISKPKYRLGNIGFKVQSEGCRLNEKIEVINAVIEKYENNAKEKLDKNSRKCSICGKSDYPVGDIPHGAIDRVPGGGSFGCTLISYHERAFEAYGLKRNNNSEICVDCARTYVEAFNWLLSSGGYVDDENKKGEKYFRFRYTNRKDIGNDTALVFWTKNNQPAEEMDAMEKPTSENVVKFTESIDRGVERNLNPELFYACILSGASSRIIVRDWIQTSLGEFHESVKHWFNDIAISEYNWELDKFETKYFSPWAFSRACQRKNINNYDKKDVIKNRIESTLWRVAIKNSEVPLWILSKVLQRIQMDYKSKSEDKEYYHGVTAERASLIKLILSRMSSKGGDFVITENLQTEGMPVAYVCGRLFAKLESIQYEALGERNAGIREKYFTYAMTLPLSALGRLFNLSSKHLSKLRAEKPGLAVNCDKEVQELCGNIDIKSLPATFSLEQQGQFALGYYHQRQYQFSKIKSKEVEEVEGEN